MFPFIKPAGQLTTDGPEAAFDRYQTEINTHDFDRLADAVISPDPLFVFDGAVHRGLAEVRAAFQAAWSALPDEVYTMTEAAWLAREDATAVVSFRYDYQGRTRDGRPARGGGRGTNVFVRIRQEWRLHYEHLSRDPQPHAG